MPRAHGVSISLLLVLVVQWHVIVSRAAACDEQLLFAPAPQECRSTSTFPGYPCRYLYDELPTASDVGTTFSRGGRWGHGEFAAKGVSTVVVTLVYAAPPEFNMMCFKPRPSPGDRTDFVVVTATPRGGMGFSINVTVPTLPASDGILACYGLGTVFSGQTAVNFTILSRHGHRTNVGGTTLTVALDGCAATPSATRSRSGATATFRLTASQQNTRTRDRSPSRALTASPVTSPSVTLRAAATSRTRSLSLQKSTSIRVSVSKTPSVNQRRHTETHSASPSRMGAVAVPVGNTSDPREATGDEPAAVPESVQTSAAVVATLGGALSPTAAARVPGFAGAARASGCADDEPFTDDEEPSRIEFPIQASTASFRPMIFAGAINAVVMFVGVFVVVADEAYRAFRGGMEGRGDDSVVATVSFGRQLAAAGAALLLAFFTPTASSAVTIVVVASTSAVEYALAALACGLSVAAHVAVVRSVHSSFNSLGDPIPERALWHPFTQGARQDARVFPRRWVFFTEVGIETVAAAVGTAAATTGKACEAFGAFLIVIGAARIGYQAVLRPYDSIVDTFFAVVQGGLYVAQGALTAGAAGSAAATRVSTSHVQMIATATFFLQPIASLIAWLRVRLAHKRDVEELGAGARHGGPLLRAPEPTSRTKASGRQRRGRSKESQRDPGSHHALTVIPRSRSGSSSSARASSHVENASASKHRNPLLVSTHQNMKPQQSRAETGS